jgi:hypothetical protein
MPNRIEREIEEILTRLDEFVPDESRMRRLRRRARAALQAVWDEVRHRTRGITAGHVVLASVVVLLVAFFLRGSFPTFFRIATWVAVGALFAAIFFSIRPVRRQSTRYWRGQPVDVRRPGLLTRLRWWLRRHGPGRR